MGLANSLGILWTYVEIGHHPVEAYAWPAPDTFREMAGNRRTATD
jgi:hypothetical protein